MMRHRKWFIELLLLTLLIVAAVGVRVWCYSMDPVLSRDGALYIRQTEYLMIHGVPGTSRAAPITSVSDRESGGNNKNAPRNGRTMDQYFFRSGVADSPVSFRKTVVRLVPSGIRPVIVCGDTSNISRVVNGISTGERLSVFLRMDFVVAG